MILPDFTTTAAAPQWLLDLTAKPARPPLVNDEERQVAFAEHRQTWLDAKAKLESVTYPAFAAAASARIAGVPEHLIDAEFNQATDVAMAEFKRTMKAADKAFDLATAK